VPLIAIALGSSLGPSARTFRLATELLCATPGLSDARPSRIFLTPPSGGVALRPFLNACVRLRCVLEPHVVLARCREIERRLGRTATPRWADRVIDLDVLLFGDRHIDTSDLTVPHPRMHDRPFQLLPLMDCWPDVPGPWRGLAAGMRRLPVVGVLRRRRRLPSAPDSAILSAC